MCSLNVIAPTAAKRNFTAVDAACLALNREARPPVLTPNRSRLLLVAATQWCRELQFPTVRAIGREMGWTSTSSVTAGFGRLIDLQAAVIRLEWHRIEGCPIVPLDDRVRWIVHHAEQLAAVDPSCLRLPGLVWSAVATADPSRVTPMPGLAAPLHALAASTEPPGRGPDLALVRTIAAAADRAAAGPVEMAVPA